MLFRSPFVGDESGRGERSEGTGFAEPSTEVPDFSRVEDFESLERGVDR
mgnify:CR=1 FL=1